MGSQFNFQTQACDRRTQVVRDAGQKQFAVGLHVREIFHHTVETHIDCLNLRGGSVFWERFRFDAFTHLIGKVGQFGKGLHHMTSKQCGAKERSHPSGYSPPQPGSAVRGIQHIVLGLKPILVAVNVEGHPETGIAIHGGRQNRLGSQRTFHHLVNQTIEAF